MGTQRVRASLESTRTTILGRESRPARGPGPVKGPGQARITPMPMERGLGLEVVPNPILPPLIPMTTLPAKFIPA